MWFIVTCESQFSHLNILSDGTNLKVYPVPRCLWSEECPPCRDIPGAADTCSSHRNTYQTGAERKKEKKTLKGFAALCRTSCWIHKEHRLYRLCVLVCVCVTLQATSMSLCLTAGLSGSCVPMTSRVSSSWARTWWDSADTEWSEHAHSSQPDTFHTIFQNPA